jgi:nitroreductase
VTALPGDQVGLLEGLVSTRAVRRYLDEPVPPEVLRAVLFAATRAPSGSNRQPFRFVVLTDGPTASAAKELLGRAARRVWEVKERTEGYTTGSGAHERSPKSRMRRTMVEYVENFERVPVVVLACLVRYREPSLMDGASIYPACQNLLLAARALGYGGVMTGFHTMVENELRPLLGIPEGVSIAATMTLGRPAGGHGGVRRRPLGELVFAERFGKPAGFAIDPPGTRHTAGGPLRAVGQAPGPGPTSPTGDVGPTGDAGR